ncbi:MAG: exosortase H [Burkholderiaceae bacterium]|jgi:exosortase H (IPTLxxWG-CTERM-specific)|nr:exosortase H [Burkholderiaceae bacterium]MCO5103150.1 exosortase H [Burkholderiaceae bacterium]
MVRFLGIFGVSLLVLFRIDMLDSVQRTVIAPWSDWLAVVSGLLMTPFDSDVMHSGRLLYSKSTGFAVSIEAGCNGIEAAIVLLAGVLAFPATWAQKAWGFIAGFGTIQVANLLRIISLYYLGRWNMEWFEFAHLYLWQALIMLDVLVVWLLWIRWVGRNAVQAKNAPTAHAI